MSTPIAAALQSSSAQLPVSLHHYMQEFQSLFEQREPAAKPALALVFTQFVAQFSAKMNKLIYVKLAIEAAKQLAPVEAIKMLDTIGEDLQKGKESEIPALVVLATMEAAHYRLRTGDLSGTKKAIESCADTAEGLASVDPIIPATFFRVSADYDKATLSFAKFYKHTLLYLSCIKLEEISVMEAQERAHDLCVAALLGDSIYNFGELLLHPILKSLQNTLFAYLEQALLAFNSGDHASFEKVLPLISQHPTLSGSLEMLRQKLCLMALVETVFRQLKSSRQLPFSIISRATLVPAEQVEFLLMKALSLKLVRGTIREPEQYFDIEWVQPRVLDRNQMVELRAGIQAWRVRVQETARLVQNILPESLSSISKC